MFCWFMLSMMLSCLAAANVCLHTSSRGATIRVKPNNSSNMAGKILIVATSYNGKLGDAPTGSW